MKTTIPYIALLLALTFSLRADPVPFEEISLLIRMHESDSYITQQVARRRLLRTLSPEQEAKLAADGASESLLQALRQPGIGLSTSEALAFETRREQQKKEILEIAAQPAVTSNHAPTYYPPSHFVESRPAVTTSSPSLASMPAIQSSTGIPINSSPSTFVTPSIVTSAQRNAAKKTENPIFDSDRGYGQRSRSTSSNSNSPITQRVGDTYFHSNGTTTQRIGNTYFNSNGSTTQRIGETYFHSNGTTTQRIGSTYFNSNGSSTQRLGDTYFHSNGTTTQRIGNTYFNSGGNTTQQSGITVFRP